MEFTLSAVKLPSKFFLESNNLLPIRYPKHVGNRYFKCEIQSRLVRLCKKTGSAHNSAWEHESSRSRRERVATVVPTGLDMTLLQADQAVPLYHRAYQYRPMIHDVDWYNFMALPTNGIERCRCLYNSLEMAL
jgi:hypothetical protein